MPAPVEIPGAPKPIYAVSPVGDAIYPKLNSPDTKWKPEGEYRVKLKLTQADAQPLIDQMTALAAEMTTAAQKQIKKKCQTARLPFDAEVDDSGNETGNVILNFKMKATSKKGPQKPVIVDAAKKPSTANIWGGSKLKVAFMMSPYYAPALGAGVSLKLRGVQIIELKTGTGGANTAEMFDVEEGYDASDEEPLVFTEATTESTTPTPATKVDASAF